MQIVEYSHRSGKSTVGTSLLNKTRAVLENVSFKIKPRCATALRETILAGLGRDGWSGEVQISRKRKLTVTAMHGHVALCLQTGNMSRFYADLLKLQAQFIEGKIKGAIYVLPTRSASRVMGQNIAHFERLTSELKEEFNRVITVPLVVIGVESEVKV